MNDFLLKLGQIIKEKRKDYDKAIVIGSFQDDAIKLEHLTHFTDDVAKAIVIGSLQDDTLKLEYLAHLTSDYSKAMVIGSLQDDTLKLEHLTHFTDDDAKAIVIGSFQDDTLKLEHLTHLTDDVAKAIVIGSFQDDILKLEYLTHSTDDFAKAIVIGLFENDTLKVENLTHLTDDDAKARVIESFQDDTLKVENLTHLTADYAKVTVISSFKDDTLKVENLTHLTEDYAKAMVIESFQDDTLKVENLTHLTDDYAKAMVIKSFQDDKLKFLKLCELNFDYLESYINHTEMPEEATIPFEVVKRYSEHYQFDLKKLSSLVNKFGYMTLRFMQQENFRKICLLPEQEFEKYLNIFDEKNLTIDKNANNTIMESLLNREFRIKVPEIYNIYSTLEQLSQTGKLKEVITILKYIDKEIPFNKYLNGLSIEEFASNLQDIKYLDILHRITNLYIDKKKNAYVNKRKESAIDEIDADTKIIYDKNFIVKKVIATTSISEIITLIKSIDVSQLTLEEQTLISSDALLTEIIKFKKSPKEYGDTSLIKKHFKTFEKIFTILYNEDKLVDKTNDPHAKKTVVKLPKKVSKEFLLSIMAEIDIEKIRTQILSDENMYQKLLEALNTYKFLGLGTSYDNLLKETNIDIDSTTIVSLIQNFPIISKKLEESLQKGTIQRINFMNMMEYAGVYGSTSFKDLLLFGRENFDLIKRNPPRNAASATSEVRLSKAIECAKDMYSREFITVPPIDTKIDIGDKKMNVVVGNTTNMMNLTYGERTGACMRICGAGDSLFNFCLTNELGFHIRFATPDTGEVISRVSGFRNGNTVFLNQLRDSEHSNYTNEQVIEACKKVANMIIEKSKESEYPI